MKWPLLRRDSIIMKSLRNKYLMAVLVFLVWLLIFDNNSLIDRVKYLNTLHEMKDEKQYYLKRIDEDSRRLNELKTDRDNLEKFAREEYFMKKENEDVFVIVEEE
jgi:cell division protein DivIC